MGESFKQDRDAIVALLDQALRDEERTEPPLAADRRNWLYGSAGLSQGTVAARKVHGEGGLA